MTSSVPLETRERVASSTVMGCCGPILPLQVGEQEAADLATIFKALANPVRLQILSILNGRAGEVCVCDVEGYFDLSQPTISHHLRVLREAGLVDAEQRGTWIYYAVKPSTLGQIRHFLDGMLTQETA